MSAPAETRDRGAPGDSRGTPARRRWLGPAIAGALFVPGALYVLAINRWHPTVPVILLLLCWAAVVTLAINLTKMATDTHDDGDLELAVGGSRDDLEHEKRKLVKAIKEVEFDRACGKMSEADAAALIATYRARAIEVLKQLDALSAERPDSPRARVEADLKARLELDKAATARPAKGKGKATRDHADAGSES